MHSKKNITTALQIDNADDVLSEATVIPEENEGAFSIIKALSLYASTVRGHATS